MKLAIISILIALLFCITIFGFFKFINDWLYGKKTSILPLVGLIYLVAALSIYHVTLILEVATRSKHKIVNKKHKIINKRLHITSITRSF